MNKKPLVVMDADALIAQTDSDDALHNKAMDISKKLKELEAQVIYPVTMIAEATAHMQRVLNSTASAYGTVETIINSQAQVAEVNKKILSHAFDYFSPKTSKKNTLFDCIVAAIAKEYEADAIFSFDGFYRKVGFKLASEL